MSRPGAAKRASLNSWFKLTYIARSQLRPLALRARECSPHDSADSAVDSRSPPLIASGALRRDDSTALRRDDSVLRPVPSSNSETVLPREAGLKTPSSTGGAELRPEAPPTTLDTKSQQETLYKFVGVDC